MLNLYIDERSTLTLKRIETHNFMGPILVLDILAGIMVYGISIALARAWYIRK